MELWAGCIAGALEETEYRAKLAIVGFEDIFVEVARSYGIEDARAFLTARGIGLDAAAWQVDGKFVSAFICARKPVESFCGSNCS